MNSWIRSITLAVVFALAGAFSASLWLEIRSEVPVATEAVSAEWEGRRIRVEVLNGAGVDELARQATERLRRRGFDVVYYGNAPEFGRDTSEAIARLGIVEPARRVADALRLRKVSHRPDKNLFLDVTVILGSDWADAGGERAEGGQDDALLAGGALWWARIKGAAGRLWPG